MAVSRTSGRPSGGAGFLGSRCPPPGCCDDYMLAERGRYVLSNKARRCGGPIAGDRAKAPPAAAAQVECQTFAVLP
jgi:hypothetical protein